MNGWMRKGFQWRSRFTAVVLGMHRSGTSAVASITEALGVHIGDELLGADQSNPTGHFEDVDLLELNEKILREGGGTWDSPPPRNRILELSDLFQQEIKKVVDEKNSQHRIWGWKDPRTCLTLELFLPHLRQPKLIVVRRNAEEIARSLRERNGIDLTAGRSLADDYYNRVDGLLAGAGAPYIELNYEELRVNAEDVVWQLASFLGIEPGRDEIRRSAEKFLSKTELDRLSSDIAKNKADNRMASSFPGLQNNVQRKAVVVVPVYNGLPSLEELVQSLQVQYPSPQTWLRFHFIDDASTDEKVKAYYEAEYFFRRGDVRVSTNDRNKGFVKSVNHGLATASVDDDVIVLNSDTIISGPVFETLLSTATRIGKVGSLTPWTNRGTIASLVDFPNGSDSIMDLSPSEVAGVIQESGIHTDSIRLPTGVGFCMLMAREAIKEVGQFNEEAFGRGYGEENDWCQRAAKAGFPSYLCGEAFVYHRETQSFSEAEKESQRKSNLEVLERLHKGYRNEVAQFVSTDPLQTARFLLNYALIKYRTRRDSTPLGLFALHKDPWFHLGGTERHVLDLVSILLDAQAGAALTLHPIEGTGELRGWRLSLISENPMTPIASIALDEAECLRVIPELLSEVEFLHVHHLQGWPDDVLKTLLGSPVKRRIVSLHDFSYICPSPNMLTDNGRRFCEVESNIDVCNRCYLNEHGGDGSGIVQYTEKWIEQLEPFEEILLPSVSALKVFEQGLRRWGLGDCLIPRLKVVPHPVRHEIAREAAHHDSKNPRVVFLGGISRHKGSELIKQAAPELIRRGINVEVWGHLVDSPSGTVVRTYNNRRELLRLGELYPPTIVAVPSVWPETFGFTAYEALLLLRVPLVTGPYGNPADVVKLYECGEVMQDCSVDQLLDKVSQVLRSIRYYRHKTLGATKELEQETRIAEQTYARLYKLDKGRRSIRPPVRRLSLEVDTKRINLNELYDLSLQNYYMMLINSKGARGYVKRFIILNSYKVGFLRRPMMALFNLRYKRRRIVH